MNTPQYDALIEAFHKVADAACRCPEMGAPPDLHHPLCATFGMIGLRDAVVAVEEYVSPTKVWVRGAFQSWIYAAERLSPGSPAWSTTPPTEPGLYWAWMPREKAVEPVSVHFGTLEFDSGVVYVDILGWDGGVGKEGIASMRWGERLTPPPAPST